MPTSYPLCYSFPADPGLSITPRYVDASGDVGGAVPATAAFEVAGWYGQTLLVDSGYRGFVGFFSPSTLVALFAVNPEEGENLDLKASTLRVKGPGGVRYSGSVRDTSDNPVAGAQVWLTSDPAGDNVVAGTVVTDSAGTFTFEVPAGTYYLWRLHGRFTIPNPKTVMVS